LHIHEHVALVPIAMHVVVAFGLSMQGFGAWRQTWRVPSQLKRPLHAFVFKRSQTGSVGPVQGSVCTQFIVGSQYEFIGHAESFGVWTHLFRFASHESFVHATPSSQFCGWPVGTQKPPMHATPFVPEQMFGAVQSSLCTHVCIIAASPPSRAASELASLDPSGVDESMRTLLSSPVTDASSPVPPSSPTPVCVVDAPFAQP
jgi:hypothetical protein